MRAAIRRMFYGLVGANRTRVLMDLERMQATVKARHDDVGEAVYDFYRCAGCRRLITRLEEIEFFDKAKTRWGVVCPSCDSRRYSPTNLRPLERLLPRVWWFAWLRFLEIG